MEKKNLVLIVCIVIFSANPTFAMEAKERLEEERHPRANSPRAKSNKKELDHTKTPKIQTPSKVPSPLPEKREKRVSIAPLPPKVPQSSRGERKNSVTPPSPRPPLEKRDPAPMCDQRPNSYVPKEQEGRPGAIPPRRVRNGSSMRKFSLSEDNKWVENVSPPSQEEKRGP